jgi:hypothetical protein
MDTRFHPALETRHGAVDLRKPSSDLELGLEVLKPDERHSGENVARQQPQGELVRVLQDPRIRDCQTQARGDLDGRTCRAYDV